MTENHLVEYKSQLTEKIERSIIGFLNTNTGGHLYIGVNDDGSVCGVENADLVQRQIADRILNISDLLQSDFLKFLQKKKMIKKLFM